MYSQRVNREKIREILNVPYSFDIVLVVALGYQAENPVVDKIENEAIKRWLDQNGVLHVGIRRA